jgi:hypothetical protein
VKARGAGWGVEETTFPIGRNSGVMMGGEPHQTQFFKLFGSCGVKAGFDGLGSVVLVRFCRIDVFRD